MRNVVVVGYTGAELVDIACVTTGMDIANRLGAGPPYRTLLASPGGNPIDCDSGLQLASQQALERYNDAIDTLVVSGGLGHDRAAADARLVAHVRRLAKQSRRVASVCTGATILAAAGLLDGRRATTHWNYARELAERYPRVNVDARPVFIRDGSIATAGGVTSALDLILAFIAEDHGAELARWVAMGMVTYLQRPGNQAQMSMFVAAPHSTDLSVRKVMGFVSKHLAGDLGTVRLAAQAGISERHLTRLFLEHIGMPPARFVRQARAEAAASLLASSDQPLSAIARKCGFSSAEAMRQTFVAQFGLPPSRYRAAHLTPGARD